MIFLKNAFYVLVFVVLLFELSPRVDAAEPPAVPQPIYAQYSCGTNGADSRYIGISTQQLSAGAVYYYLYVKTDTGNFEQISGNSIPAFWYKDGIPGEVKTFKMRSMANIGNVLSDFSPEVSQVVPFSTAEDCSKNPPIMQSLPPNSLSLTANTCNINIGQAACSIESFSLNGNGGVYGDYNLHNTKTNKSVLAFYPGNKYEYSDNTTITDPEVVEIGYGSTVFKARSTLAPGLDLASLTLNAKCVMGSVWNGSKCEKVAFLGTSCEIPDGASSCRATALIFTDYESGKTYDLYNHKSLLTTTNAFFGPLYRYEGGLGETSALITYGDNKLSVRESNKTDDLATITLNAKCAANTSWDGVRCKGLTTAAPKPTFPTNFIGSCTIRDGESYCLPWQPMPVAAWKNATAPGSVKLRYINPYPTKTTYNGTKTISNLLNSPGTAINVRYGYDNQIFNELGNGYSFPFRRIAGYCEVGTGWDGDKCTSAEPYKKHVTYIEVIHGVTKLWPGEPYSDLTINTSGVVQAVVNEKLTFSLRAGIANQGPSEGLTFSSNMLEWVDPDGKVHACTEDPNSAYALINTSAGNKRGCLVSPVAGVSYAIDFTPKKAGTYILRHKAYLSDARLIVSPDLKIEVKEVTTGPTQPKAQSSASSALQARASSTIAIMDEGIVKLQTLLNSTSDLEQKTLVSKAITSTALYRSLIVNIYNRADYINSRKLAELVIKYVYLFLKEPIPEMLR